jgi:hypothetical protein
MRSCYPSGWSLRHEILMVDSEGDGRTASEIVGNGLEAEYITLWLCRAVLARLEETHEAMRAPPWTRQCTRHASVAPYDCTRDLPR